MQTEIILFIRWGWRYFKYGRIFTIFICNNVTVTWIIINHTRDQAHIFWLIKFSFYFNVSKCFCCWYCHPLVCLPSRYQWKVSSNVLHYWHFVLSVFLDWCILYMYLYEYEMNYQISVNSESNRHLKSFF